jgi:superfamily II DNA or RNA helicase
MAISETRKQRLLKLAQGKPDELEVPKSMKEWFKPYPHQADAAKKLLNNNGRLILAHGVGTGKTVSSIYGFELLKNRGRARKALVVVPAGLRENFAEGGIKKFLNAPNYQIVGSATEKGRPGYVRPGEVSPDKDYTIVSYSMFRRHPEALMDATGSDTLIFDEYHRTRNEKGGTFKAAMRARSRARNFMGLTGSLVNNNPSEVATLLTISSNQRFMSPAQFRSRFTKTIGFEKGFLGGKKKVKKVTRKPELVTLVDPRVHYVPTESLKGKSMPRKNVKFVDVPMSEDQDKLYNLALDRLGPVKEYITRKDPKVIVKDIDPKFLFAQTAHARQISNSVGMGRKMSLSESAVNTPKVRKLVNDAVKHIKENPDGKVVVYSNLIRGGVDVLQAGLKDRGLDPAIFIGKGTEIGKGKVTSKSRDLGVASFKKGKKKVIILSGAGAEGLNLPNTTAFLALDGHFNPERVLQAEARGRRLGGQAHRAPEKRVLEVRRYRNIAPESKKPGFFGKLLGKKAPKTTDQWVYDVAKRKYMQNKDFYETIKAPHKYIKKYRDSRTGRWRYEYPKRNA